MPPFTSSPRVPSGPRRRSLLASAAGAALLVGCSAGSGADGTDGSPPAADRARARAARDSERLAARYDAVIAAHPALAGRLRPLREEVVRHARAFGGGGAAAGAAPEASRTPVASSVSPSDAVPEGEREALARLAADERELAGRRSRELAAVPGELARLLASVAAAGAAHVYLLTEGDG